jgi:lipopolysaccharide/colanic/teichoic acid biosynthesis glycosyltransferase
VQAAILDLKLQHLPGWIERRRRIAEIYNETLTGIAGLRLPPGPDGGPHFDVYQNYVIESDDRDQLVQHLANNGIETLVSWPVPMHHQPLGLNHFSLPSTESVCLLTASRSIKRVLDVALSFIAIVILSPLMVAIWLRIRFQRNGPAIYRGIRVGLNGRLFAILKYRTMVTNAERLGGPSTADDDPRLTPLGKSLRRYKLDELPQLFNVFSGEMSFVGPRPQVPSEVADYTVEERQILSVRPGITDWASLRFHNEGEILRGHDNPDQAYAELIRPEKMRLGLEYARRATLVDDLRILFDTARLPFLRSHRSSNEG